MAKRKSFKETLGGAWLLFFVVGVILVGGAFGTSLLKRTLAAHGVPEWLQALPGAIFLILSVRLLARQMR